jgi:hypothetical protein
MDNFDAHKWFKKEYLGEGHTEDKVVAKGEGIEITQDQMKRLHNGEVVRLSNGSTLSFVKEGHTEDKMIDDMEARKRSKLSPDELKKLDAMRAFYRGETDVLPAELKENMSPGEAVVELNYLMDELQNISGEVKQIMQQTFPDEYTRGDAYGAFDFGTSGNRYDTTFEGILDDLASVGDEME